MPGESPYLPSWTVLTGRKAGTSMQSALVQLSGEISCFAFEVNSRLPGFRRQIADGRQAPLLEPADLVRPVLLRHLLDTW
jgi:hypothetical protein